MAAIKAVPASPPRQMANHQGTATMGTLYHDDVAEANGMTARDWLAGLGTGLVAGVDAASLGISGRVADLLRWQ